MDSNSILEEEQAITLPYFGLEQVDELATLFSKVDPVAFQKVCIKVVLNNREVYFHAGIQTSKENNDWVTRKFNVTNMFDHCSLYVKTLWAEQPAAFFNSYGLSHRDFALVGGALPIITKGNGNIGILVISGLTDTEDHEFGVKVLKQLKHQLLS